MPTKLALLLKKINQGLGRTTEITKVWNKETKEYEQSLKTIVFDQEKITKATQKELEIRQKLADAIADGREKSRNSAHAEALKINQQLNKELEKQRIEEEHVVNTIHEAIALTIQRREEEQRIWNLKQDQAINKHLESEYKTTQEKKQTIRIYKRTY